MPAIEVDEDFVRARVDFELKLKTAQGNHGLITELTFRDVQLMRKPEWLKQMADAVAANTACTSLDLSHSGLTDLALQQLAATLAVPSRCPKLRKLNLSGNPQISKLGETVASGLSKLRAGLEVIMDDGLDAAAEGFLHDKQLVPGKSSWNCDELKPEGGGQFDFYCPEEVIEAAGAAAVADARAEAGTADGERLKLTRGFQGPNGTKFKTTFATFEHIHATGNMVLMTLDDPDAEGVEV
jgi:hypothetical protein